MRPWKKPSVTRPRKWRGAAGRWACRYRRAPTSANGSCPAAWGGERDFRSRRSEYLAYNWRAMAFNSGSPYPESVNRLMNELASLPGIGRRTAERLAFYILKSERGKALGLARAIQDVKQNVHHCGICFNLTEDDPCPI